MKRLLSLLLALVLALSAAAFAEGKPEFSGMNDPSLLQYIEDDLYENLVTSLDSDEYFVENVQAVYISQEYLDEVAYKPIILRRTSSLDSRSPSWRHSSPANATCSPSATTARRRFSPLKTTTIPTIAFFTISPSVPASF